MDAITELRLDRVENDVESTRATQRSMLDQFYRFDNMLRETRDTVAENRMRLERVENRQVELIEFVVENRAMIKGNRALIENNGAMIMVAR